jgi:hypothetical protein
LGYDVVPVSQRGQPTLISLNVCRKGHILVYFIDLIIVPNSLHPFGLCGSKCLSKDFPFKGIDLTCGSLGKSPHFTVIH